MYAQPSDTVLTEASNALNQIHDDDPTQTTTTLETAALAPDTPLDIDGIRAANAWRTLVVPPDGTPESSDSDHTS